MITCCTTTSKEAYVCWVCTLKILNTVIDVSQNDLWCSLMQILVFNYQIKSKHALVTTISIHNVMTTMMHWDLSIPSVIIARGSSSNDDDNNTIMLLTPNAFWKINHWLLKIFFEKYQYDALWWSRKDLNSIIWDQEKKYDGIIILSQ